jgi:hypothetical protein
LRKRPGYRRVLDEARGRQGHDRRRRRTVASGSEPSACNRFPIVNDPGDQDWLRNGERLIDWTLAMPLVSSNLRPLADRMHAFAKNQNDAGEHERSH